MLIQRWHGRLIEIDVINGGLRIDWKKIIEE